MARLGASVARDDGRIATLLMDYVTTGDLRAVIAPLSTRKEMNAAIARAIAPPATREEMREDGERTRRHMEILIEGLRDDIRLLADGQVALHHRIEDVRTELKTDIAALDRRVMRLEARRA